MFKLVNKGAKSNLPFSPAFIVGDCMHISGQASVSPDDGTIISGSFEEEMRRSIENLDAILKAAGLTLNHVFSVRCYLGDAADGASHNEIFAEYFSEPRPVRSTISGVLSTKLKYELDAIAYVPATRQEAELSD